MRKNLCAMMLAGSVLLGLTACSNYEPLVSRDGAATGSAVSGNSVTSVVSGGAVESNSRDKQEREKGNQTSSLSRWYRNCNSRKMYYSAYQEKDKACHLVQYNLNVSGKKVLKTKAEEILWVSDEFIYIDFNGKIYQIPLRHEEGQKESLDVASKKCVISDAYYDCEPVLGMDDNDIYYLNEKEKLIEYDIKSGESREIKINSKIKKKAFIYGANIKMTDNKVFIADTDAIYCIHRDTLELEMITSLDSNSTSYSDYMAYQEESDNFFFVQYNHDNKSNWHTELMLYDGDATRCVASAEEMEKVLYEHLGISRKKRKLGDMDIYGLYSCDGNVYLEYSVESDRDLEMICGMLVYDKNGELHEEEKLEEQIKKHFPKSDGYYYEVSGLEGDRIYIGDDLIDTADYVFSYNFLTGEMKKTSEKKIRLLDYCYGIYNRDEFYEL